MKLAILALTCITFNPVRGALLGTSSDSALRGSASAFELQQSSVQELVQNLISGEGSVRFSHVIAEASKHVNFAEASSALRQQHSLPKEVSALLARTTSNNSQALTEESLTKARQFLNQLVEAAYVELDAKVIEAKEFEAMNRGTWQQVVADIARLGQQIADHIRRAAEATACIASVSRQIDDVRARRQEEYEAYMKEYNIHYADLQIKQNDLDVFDFLIKTTKSICDSQSGLLLADVKGQKMEVCETHGESTLRFSDVAMQQKFDRLLVKGSKSLLRNALMKTRSTKVSLLQQPASAQSTGPKVPTIEGQADEFGDMKCGPIPDCGLLYDTLSLEWGGYKDQVDELKKLMADNAAAWAELKADFDAQIDSLTAALDECVGQLAEATAAKNADQQELAEKEEERRVLNAEHKKTMAQFRERIKYIFNQDICGPTVIRNEVMKKSTDCAPKLIDDCDVTAWAPDVCSVECDDTCPESVGCGGVRRLTREAVVRPNACGIKCPAFTVIQKCNQFKCPVDCLMSRWSGWSKCSKDCEGGVEERTRSILTKPKNGGKGCSAVSDGRPCNTGSCDRDCTLEEWTSWSPCSMACDRGNQYRVRKVDIPIRGGGKCPKPKSSHRYEMQDCNAHACIGDEICIANQDLILNIDGSGSVNAENWLLITNFTGELLKRYQATYYHAPAVRLGVTLYGNGVIEADGTISKAILVSELVGSEEGAFAAVKEAVAKMAQDGWRKEAKMKGFTNMAQGFVLAEKLLQQRGRKDAQSAVLTISDGKPSFLFETTEKAKELGDKGIMKYMVGIAEFPGSDEWRLMRDLASQPADTNTVRVPGFDALQDGGGPFVREAIAKFCPAAMSPSQTRDQETVQGWMLVYRKGYCGGLGRTLSRDTVDPEGCRKLAVDAGATGFSMGRRYRKGKC